MTAWTEEAIAAKGLKVRQTGGAAAPVHEGLKLRAHKYNAKKTIVDGEEFDSKAEADRYQTLRLLERARVIRAVGRQPRYVLCVEGEPIGEVVWDFAYFEAGRKIVEDVKGVSTRMFLWKRKHFLRQYPGIELRVIGADGKVKQIKTRKPLKQRKVAA